MEGRKITHGPDQPPLYGCCNCYEERSLRADDLAVHDGEAWCEDCWDERRSEQEELPFWSQLQPFKPSPAQQVIQEVDWQGNANMLVGQESGMVVFRFRNPINIMQLSPDQATHLSNALKSLASEAAAKCAPTPGMVQ